MKKILAFLTLFSVLNIAHAQERKLIFTPIDIGNFEITISSGDTVRKTYNWLVDKKVFAVDLGPLGSVTPACKLEVIGEGYKHRVFYVFIRDPKDDVEGALTGVELYDLFELMGMNKLIRYLTRPDNLKTETGEKR